MDGIGIGTGERTIDKIVESWRYKMDKTFEKYIPGETAPCLLVDKDEILSIALGMGLAKFHPTKRGLNLERLNQFP